MENLAPIPKKGESYWFYANDQIKKDTEFEAIVTEIYPFVKTTEKSIYKYDDYFEEVIATPLMDLWLEEVEDLFWILADKTDYIIELNIPDLCKSKVYVARDFDGNWHSFETISQKEFGILDVTGSLHRSIEILNN